MNYYYINNNFGYNVMGRISISQWINLNGDPMERQLRLNVIGRISLSQWINYNPARAHMARDSGRRAYLDWGSLIIHRTIFFGFAFPTGICFFWLKCDVIRGPFCCHFFWFFWPFCCHFFWMKKIFHHGEILF